MSNETVTETQTQTPAHFDINEANKISKRTQGRGELGTASTSDLIKQMWHKATHKRVKNHDDDHPTRKTWVKMDGAPSLNSFAKKLASEGVQIAQDWLDHKDGSLNQTRTLENMKRATESRSATKLAKRKRAVKTEKKPE